MKMNKISSVFKRDIKNIFTNSMAIIMVVGILILPSLYAWVNIYANWDPYSASSTHNMKIAVMIEDIGTEFGGSSINVGNQIKENLEGNNAIDWQFVSVDEGIQGVKSSEYYAAILVPANFSESLTSIVSDDFTPPQITYYSNEKKNAIATKITDSVVRTVQQQVNKSFIETIAGVVNKVTGVLVDSEGNSSATVESIKSDIELIKSNIDTLNNAVESVIGVAETINSVAAMIPIDALQQSLNESNENLNNFSAMLASFSSKLDSFALTIESLANSENLGAIYNLFVVNGDELGAFIATPVEVDNNSIYSIENYGSAMAPFYTTLAIWVGGIILIAIFKTRVKRKTELSGVNYFEEYFGRGLTFLCFSLCQALIIAIGDLLILGIQCNHPILFILCSVVASAVFSLFIYSLTFAFGDIGKAIVVILLVIQLGGSGGTFPIDVTPAFFRNVNPFLPFTFIINAMRSCVCEPYGGDYWLCLLKLCAYIPVSLLIGLGLGYVMKKPISFFAKKSEETGLL